MKRTPQPRRSSPISPTIAVIGLGYVGLPVALGFAERFEDVVGFDISAARVEALSRGEDWTGETDAARLKASRLVVSGDSAALRGRDVFVVCVPTPIHDDRRPDLRPLESASRLVGSVIAPGAVVVFESTVWPGLTETVCGPIIAEASGLRQGVDFKLGYSPERINPGDRDHTLERIVKVVAGEDAETTERLAELYGAIVPAGVHRASSIKVAEAAKVLENTQRDLNIALMNELAIICDLMEIRTRDVLDAAGTKWNFLKFTPGLVGGHCIGVDPYYLTSKAQELGYHPEVILAGRRINDSMGGYVALRAIRMLGSVVANLHEARVGVLGLTFKENVSDIRNSRVPDIVRELRRFAIEPMVADCMADPAEVLQETGLKLSPDAALENLDCLILAVPHRDYLADLDRVVSRVRPGGAVVDVKSALDPGSLRSDLAYWSL